MPPRTLRLTEYRPREVRLRRTDVEALLADPYKAVEIVPTRERGRYRLTAAGRVGVLLTPNLRVIIRPKIPAANLYLLLDPDAPPESTPDLAGVEPGTKAIDFLARRLADAMRARAATGLRRDYVERVGQQPFLQGRLDVAAQARESPAARDRFHVTRQEFSADSPFNRLPKATAEALVASPFVSSGTRTYLRSVLAGYAGVSSTALDAAAFDAIAFDRLTEPERPIIDLCRLLARALRPSDASGELALPGFLLDLERVFERYVERGLRTHLPATEIESQREFRYHASVAAGQPTLAGRPDLVIRRGGKPACAIDAKWKALDGPPPAADVHQALAYALGLACRDVRLVYPGRRSDAWRYELSESDVILTVHTLRVVGPRERCERSVRRLARAV